MTTDRPIPLAAPVTRTTEEVGVDVEAILETDETITNVINWKLWPAAINGMPNAYSRNQNLSIASQLAASH